MSSDRYDTAKANRAWRTRFIDKAKKLGFGPGALMELKPHEGLSGWSLERLQESIKKHGSLAMVIGFREECLNKDLEQESYLAGHKRTVVKIRFTSGLNSRAPLPCEFEELLEDEIVGRSWTIGCKVDAADIEKRFTWDWKSGKAGVDDQLGLND